MAIDTSIPRTRRALLAGGIGGLAAVVASALGRPLPAMAGDGDAVTVGSDLTATSSTRITNATNGNDVIQGASATGRGIVGTSTSGDGVYGSSDSGSGVSGSSWNGDGVYGWAGGLESHGVHGIAGVMTGTGCGARGHAASHDGYGVYGDAPRIGVFGDATDTTTEAYGVQGRTVSPAGRAVFGRSEGATGGTGVFGQADSAAGVGVRGLAWDTDAATGEYGTGVLGFAGVHTKASWPKARANTGVYGHSPSGTGVYGSSTTGYALRAVGRVKLDKCAGVATIPASASSVVVTPGIDLVSTSAVVATLQGNAGSATTTVSRCYVNVTTNTFTIYLTKAAAQQVKVAWIVLG